MRVRGNSGGGFPSTLPTETDYHPIGTWNSGEYKRIPTTKKAKAVIVTGYVNTGSGGTIVSFSYYYAADNPTQALYLASNNSSIVTQSVQSNFTDNYIDVGRVGAATFLLSEAMIIYD